MRTANNPTPADDEAGAAGSAHPEPDLSSRSDRRPTADEKPRLLELSLTQLIGGALAAGTAAVLGSRLGLAGTITGAVVVSLLTATGAAVYTASLRHGRDKIRAAVAGTRIAPRRVRVLAVGAGTLAILGTGFAVVTGFELLAGHALSGGGSTTVQQLGPHNGGGAVPSTAPAQPTGTTSAPTTATTKVSPTTTVTVTASPTPTRTTTPTATPTPTPTPTGSAGPSSVAP